MIRGSAGAVRPALVVVTVLGALALWLGVDLLAPRRVDIRGFDPDEVARLDAAMWPS